MEITMTLLTPGMKLHLKKTPELNTLYALLTKVYMPLKNPTLEMVAIQRNALLNIIMDILTITQPAEAKKYQNLFFNIHEIFPEKDYCPYSTGNNLEKNIALNKALFDLGYSLCNFHTPHTEDNVSCNLLKYFSIHIDTPSPTTYRKHLQWATDEELSYQKHKDILPSEMLDTASSFTQTRSRCYSRHSSSLNHLIPSF